MGRPYTQNIEPDVSCPDECGTHRRELRMVRCALRLKAHEPPLHLVEVVRLEIAACFHSLGHDQQHGTGHLQSDAWQGLHVGAAKHAVLDSASKPQSSQLLKTGVAVGTVLRSLLQAFVLSSSAAQRH